MEKKIKEVKWRGQLLEIKKSNDGLQFGTTELVFMKKVFDRFSDNYMGSPNWITYHYLYDNLKSHLLEKLGKNKLGLKHGDEVEITIKKLKTPKGR